MVCIARLRHRRRDRHLLATSGLRCMSANMRVFSFGQMDLDSHRILAPQTHESRSLIVVKTQGPRFTQLDQTECHGGRHNPNFQFRRLCFVSRIPLVCPGRRPDPGRGYAGSESEYRSPFFEPGTVTTRLFRGSPRTHPDPADPISLTEQSRQAPVACQ